MGYADYAVRDAIIALSRYLLLDRVFPGYESFFKKHPKVGLHFSVEINATNHGYELGGTGSTHHPEWEGRYWKMLHILVVQPHRLYIATTNEHDPKKVKPSEYKNFSNHDSEWKSGLQHINTVAYEAYKRVYDLTPEKHRPAPIAANITISMTPLFNKVFRFAIVQREDLPDNEDSNRGYFDQIKSIDFVDHDLTLRVKQEAEWK